MSKIKGKKKRKNNKSSRPKTTRHKKTAPANRFFHYLPLLVIIVAFSVCYYFIFDSKIYVNGDNASYYLLAKSLFMGEGYNNYNYIDASPANQFPPGYPLILAFLMFFSKSIVFMKLMNGLFTLGSLLLLYQIFKKFGLSWSVALTAILFSVANYHIMQYSTVMMSEAAFMFFSVLSIYLLTRINIRSPNILKDPVFYTLIICIAAAYHIRSVGIALLFAVVIYFIFNKQWKKTAVTIGGFILLALPWIIRTKVAGANSAYQTALLKINPYRPELGDAGFIDIMYRIGHNFVRYFSKEIPNGLLPFVQVNYKQAAELNTWLIGAALIALIIYGLTRFPKKYIALIFAYLLATFGILLVWPHVWFGTRFIMAILPFLTVLAILAFSDLLQRFLALFQWQFNYSAFVLLPLLYYFTFQVNPPKAPDWQTYTLQRLNYTASVDYLPKWKRYFEMAEWAKKNLKDTDIIACRKPMLFHIFSDRFTYYYPYQEDDQKLMESLKEKGVTHIVVDQLGFSSTGLYLVPAVQKNSQHFRLLHKIEDPDTYLFQFIPPQ